MSSKPERPSQAPRGIFVELVRLVLVLLFTAGGWQIGRSTGATGSRLLLFVVLGSLIGYVVGGVLGRRTVVAVSAVERDFQRMPASELLAGSIGLILGLVIAVLVSFFLFRLPPEVGYPVAALVTLVLGYLGFRVGRSKREEFFGAFGLRTRSLSSQAGEENVLDTSALIDGRVLDVVRAGFMGGTLLVTRGVLDELQSIADSSDPSRRIRGRRGLDCIRAFQKMPHLEVSLVEDGDEQGDVDARLVKLARERGAALVTTDANLAKLAAAVDVTSRSLNELAEALRAPFVPGEEVSVRLTREGREHGQAVGFLDDGTMVVVEKAKERLGSEVSVTVTNVLQTPTGKMVFGRLGAG